jgi:guanine deaminase
LLAHGTTTAAVFPTVHAHSVDALFEAAQSRGMRMLAGKVMMDRNAPAALQDTVKSAEADCTRLIEKWHNKARLQYVVTPRFAPTSTPAQLALAGDLCRAYGLAAQSHVAENRDEVAWVKSLFPKARSYLDVYAEAGLLTPGSIYAHGIWLDDTDRRTLAASGAAIAFCPSSNSFIGSGLFNYGEAHAAQVSVGVGTDVGGGTSYSVLQTLAEAYKVLQLQGQNLHPLRALYLATLGGAQALNQQQHIGNFAVGKEADVCVLNWASDAVQAHRQSVAKDWIEQVFCLVLSGSLHNIATVYVAGEQVNTRANAQR